MAHPFQDKRSDKVEKSRVDRIAHRATGGSVHSDEKEDKALVRKMVKDTALKMEGGAVGARGDRPNRARGGPVKTKNAKGVTVNVIVAPAGGEGIAPTPPLPQGGPPPAPPMMPPKPMLPPGMPPSAALPPPVGMPMPPRSSGGRAGYKSGGAVSDASQGATKVQHDNAKQVDIDNMDRGPVVTKAAGGPINADGAAGKQMAPHMPGGGRGGLARLAKAHRAASKR